MPVSGDLLHDQQPVKIALVDAEVGAALRVRSSRLAA
jgi:hypothetical protein